MSFLGKPAVEIHQNIGDHIHAHIVTLPKGADSFEELFAHGAALDHARAGNIVEDDADKVLGDQGEDGRSYLLGEPTFFELLDPLVKLETGFLKDYLIGVSVKLLKG